MTSGRPPSKDGPRITASRRGFLGTIATSVVAGAGTSGTVSAQQETVVSMGNNYFDPIGLRIEPGTTVRFEIEAGSHSATAYGDRIPTEATPFDSDVMSEGSFDRTFDVPGTYDYYCIPHESMGMVGRIVVGEPGGPAEDGSIPQGTVPSSEAIVEQGRISTDEFEGGGDSPRGHMMGPGMTSRGRSWWMSLVPIGFFSVLLASVGGVAYLAARAGTASGKRGDAAKPTLREQRARGDAEREASERQCDQRKRGP